MPLALGFGLLLTLGRADAAPNRSNLNLKITAQERWVLAEEGRREPWTGEDVEDRCWKHTRHHGVSSTRPKQSKRLGAGSQSFLELEPSVAIPGAGSEQTLAGPTTNGQINGHGVDETAWKDGYAYVGCHADSMVKSFDKFGNNADKYSPGLADVSIVWYNQHVMSNERKSMTHQACFEFCRGVEHMVFFGIQNGDGCYCMPYYQKMPSDSGTCDVPCPGNPSTVCGSKSKSSIFAMHFCNDAAQDVIAAATGAGNVLAFYEREAWNCEGLAWRMQGGGENLQEIAGLGGDPVAAKWGQQAKEHAGELKHTLWDGKCYETFHKFQDAYHSAEETSTMDLSTPANLDRADAEILDFKILSKTLYSCAVKAEEALTTGNPWHVEQSASWRDADWGRGWWRKNYAEWQKAQMLYYPLQYGLEFEGRSPSSWTTTMSSCDGEAIGKPMPLTLAQCAAACEKAVYPQRCVGYQHYSFGGKGDFKWPVCVLFTEIKSLVEYQCLFLTQYYSGMWSFMQEEVQEGLQQQQHQGMALRLRGGVGGNATSDTDKGKGKEKETKDRPITFCDAVRFWVFFTGRSCRELWGWWRTPEQQCPQVCDKSKGAMSSAGCFARVSEVSAGAFSHVEIKKADRCFGGDTNRFEDEDTAQTDAPPLPDPDSPIKSGPLSMKATDWWTPRKRLSGASR